jgi:hypothetical protein
VSDEPGVAGEQGDLVARLRVVIGAKDEQIAVLTASLEVALARLGAAAAEAAASRDRERRLELRVAELERRLSMDSTDSGTPSSKERTGRRRHGGPGRSPSGSAGRTASAAASPVTRGKACCGIRTRARGRPRIRRRNAVRARRAWTARRRWSRGGRRSSTRRSSGR